MTLPATSPVVVFLALLGASVWVGGFITLLLVERVARRHLGADSRVVFFRALGRDYGIVSGVALVLALVCGTILLAGHANGAAATAAFVLAAVLLVATVAGVVQAKAMTRLRRSVLRQPDDGELRARQHRGARQAAVLRGLIGLLSVILLALAATLV